MKKILLLFALLCALPLLAQTATSGSITATDSACRPTSCVQYVIPQSVETSVATVGIQIQGTFVATMTFESTVDGSNWVTAACISAIGASESTATGEGVWACPVAGITGFRVRASAYTSGTANVSIQASGEGSPTPVTSSVTVTGNVTVVQPTASNLNATVVGTKTDNNAVPGATNIGALPAIANAAHPSATETFMAALSVDLKKNLRQIVCDAALNDRCANVDANNNLQVVAPLITYNSTQPTKTNGQTSDFQINSRAELLVAPGVSQATGAAVPANANYIAGNGTGNTTGYLRCDSSVVYDTNTNGKTQLVGLTSSQVVYVCGISLSNSTTTTVTVSLGSGTGTNCGSTYTAKTPAWPLQAPTSVAPAGLVLPVANVPWFQTAASEELCISTSAGVSVQALVVYTKF